MNQFVLFEPSTSATTPTVTIRGTASPAARPPVDEKIVDSVLQYIRAIRRLGRTTISTRDVADALGLAHDTVVAATKNLRDHGVKGL